MAVHANRVRHALQGCHRRILLQPTHIWAGCSATVFRVDLSRRLADTLRTLRETEGLSQVQMAKRLRISRSTLNRLEAADQNTTIKTLNHLCAVLRWDVGDLFRGAPRTTPGRKRPPA